MHPHRLRAPSSDGALLADPALEQAELALLENADRLDRWDYDFQGRKADRLRTMARAQVIALAKRHHEAFGLDWPDVPAQPDRLVVTGHQPELFHPGVWVKNFAVAGLAEKSGGVGLNLIVDNDIPKGPTIRVPHRDESGLRASAVAFDVWAGEVPYEDQAVQDEGLFASFADRALSTMGGLVDRPILEEFWPRVLRRADDTSRVGLRFALARREVEADWGVRNIEVTLGSLCETEAFGWFASHLLAQLPRFQATHNAALARYRAAYGIRSKNHPVPALAIQEDWLEAPFWAWRAQSPRRRPLMARLLPRSIELRIGGEDRPFLELPLSADRDACCAVGALCELPSKGIRVRTRALTTTMFSRYLLGDLFVHGIGGAKYDELGDEVARGFFGIEPPRFLTLSLTQWIGLESDTASPEALRAVDRSIRDLEFNPDRHLPDPRPVEARAAIEAKWIAIEGEVTYRKQRLERLRSIRQANLELARWTEPARARLLAERERLRSGLKLNGVARSREYAFPLHDGRRLRGALTGVRDQAAGR
ncbi:hypothetical protein P12x_003367 [Tundrisphaera lichenicola]|uniref:hypothetical protein n=1 Tax=Tundrisphaera lichenicola TaxID=2029860 RepID=UPI003EBFF0DE